MSMSLFFPIDDSLTGSSRCSQSMAFLGPPKSCKTSLSFGIAFKLLGEDVTAGRENTSVVYMVPTKIETAPLHVHHMPLATAENKIANRIVIEVFSSMKNLLEFSAMYHSLERNTAPRAFILDDLHIMAKREPNQRDSQNYVHKIIANFLDLSNYYFNKFGVPCYVIIIANDDVVADVGCCVQVANNLVSTVIHVEEIMRKVVEEEKNSELLTANDFVSYRMRDVNSGFVAYFKIEGLEIFYERLTRIQ